MIFNIKLLNYQRLHRPLRLNSIVSDQVIHASRLVPRKKAARCVVLVGCLWSVYVWHPPKKIDT
jgi:hypothetical protein